MVGRLAPQSRFSKKTPTFAFFANFCLKPLCFFGQTPPGPDRAILHFVKSFVL
jgi:hypothetical protein